MITAMKKFGRWSPVLALVFAALWLAGCQSSSPTFADFSGPQTAPATTGTAPAATGGDAQQTSSSRPPSLVAEGQIDRIRVGDSLSINFSDLPNPEPEKTERVKEDGTITLLQNQTFVAAGKTRGELEKEIRDRYVPRIFVSMTVSVQKQRESQFIFVGGEVRSPGRLLYMDRITVTKAIQSAGDFTDFANRRDVLLYRLNADKPIRVNCKKIIEDPTLDPEVFPGDRIHVKRSIL